MAGPQELGKSLEALGRRQLGGDTLIVGGEVGLVAGRVVIGPPGSLGQGAKGRLNLRSHNHRGDRSWCRQRVGRWGGESQAELQWDGEGQGSIGRHGRIH